MVSTRSARSIGHFPLIGVGVRTNVMRDENQVFAEFMSELVSDKKDELRKELHRQLRKHAFAVCWKRLGEYSPEVVDLVVWKAFKTLEGFRGDSKFSTWFQEIVENQCTSEIRNRARRKETSIEELTPGQLEELSTSSDMDSKIDFERVAGQVTESKDVIILRMKLAGEDENAIAAATDLTAEGVRTRWFRMRERLKRKLGRAFS